MDQPVKREQIACGGMVFDALTAGPAEGEPVILLHGFPEFSEQWTDQLIALGNAGYRAVAFDQRGYSSGARPEAVSDYEVWNLMADVLAVADTIGASRFHVVGHDWGGIVGWTLASRHPERIRTLTVFSTPHPVALHEAAQSGDQKERLQYVNLFRTPEVAETTFLSSESAVLRGVYEGKVPADRVALYVQRFNEPGTLTGAFKWYRALGDWIVLVPFAGRVTTPTLLVWSTLDMAIGRDAAHATKAWVDGPYRFEVLEGITHWIPEEVPETANRLLLEHISR
jgi:pimeloyl-ACP methyl ester carboxylesterase